MPSTGTTEDTVWLWRSDFGRVGVEPLKASVAPGPPPVKSETGLDVITRSLVEPVADRPIGQPYDPKPPAEHLARVGTGQKVLGPVCNQIAGLALSAAASTVYDVQSQARPSYGWDFGPGR